MQNQFVNDIALCKRYGISKSSIRRRVQDGTLPPPVKIGNLKRWRLADLDSNDEQLEYVKPGEGQS